MPPGNQIQLMPESCPSGRGKTIGPMVGLLKGNAMQKERKRARQKETRQRPLSSGRKTWLIGEIEVGKNKKEKILRGHTNRGEKRLRVC